MVIKEKDHPSVLNVSEQMYSHLMNCEHLKVTNQTQMQMSITAGITTTFVVLFSVCMDVFQMSKCRKISGYGDKFIHCVI